MHHPWSTRSTCSQGIKHYPPTWTQEGSWGLQALRTWSSHREFYSLHIQASEAKRVSGRAWQMLRNTRRKPKHLLQRSSALLFNPSCSVSFSCYTRSSSSSAPIVSCTPSLKHPYWPLYPIVFLLPTEQEALRSIKGQKVRKGSWSQKVTRLQGQLKCNVSHLALLSAVYSLLYLQISLHFCHWWRNT